MAEDLGTWPPEQATVLVDALQKAGLTPDARRTRHGISVSVPDEQSDEAHRTLVANMDAIARAAHPPAPAGRRSRGAPSARRQGGEAPGETPLASQRMLRIARPVGLLVIALMVAAVVRQPIVVLAMMAALVYVLGRQAQRRGDGDDRRI